MKSNDIRKTSDPYDADSICIIDIETVTPKEAGQSTFPKWPRHTPVVACMLKADRVQSGYNFSFRSAICQPGEEDDFLREIDAVLPPGTVGISFNGRGFDLPVLALTAMAQRQFGLRHLARQERSFRYGKEHYDLAHLLTNHGATQTASLAEICEPLGIPVKTQGHGSHVGELWEAGKSEEIIRYCFEDVVATYVVWLHHLAWRQSDAGLMALPLLDLVAAIERTPALDFLLPFASCPPAIWARSQGIVERLRMHAERAMVRAREERIRQSIL